jgi:5-(carboxyamino)imidazole ribonucleotide mutase
MAGKALVGIVCGSTSDFETVKPALVTLDELRIPYSLDVKSAHRMPDDMVKYARGAERKGLRVIIACAGGAVDLSGMIAAYTILPVIGLPVKTSALGGIDSLYSMVQMPEGIPVGTMGIDRAKNAALYAAAIIATHDESVRERLRTYRANLTTTTRTEATKRVAELKKELKLRSLV